MSKGNNPYSKFLIDPSNIPDPNTISMEKFLAYDSYQMNKSRANFKVFKNSLFYLGGMVGLILLSVSYS